MLEKDEYDWLSFVTVINSGKKYAEIGTVNVIMRCNIEQGFNTVNLFSSPCKEWH